MRDQSVRTGAVAVGEDIGTVQFTVNRFTFSALSKSKFPPAIRCCAVRAFRGSNRQNTTRRKSFAGDQRTGLPRRNAPGENLVQRDQECGSGGRRTARKDKGWGNGF